MPNQRRRLSGLAMALIGIVLFFGAGLVALFSFFPATHDPRPGVGWAGTAVSCLGSVLIAIGFIRNRREQYEWEKKEAVRKVAKQATRDNLASSLWQLINRSAPQEIRLLPWQQDITPNEFNVWLEVLSDEGLVWLLQHGLVTADWQRKEDLTCPPNLSSGGCLVFDFVKNQAKQPA